jgi:uncharacterized LabA/DUF88 family protein
MFRKGRGVFAPVRLVEINREEEAGLVLKQRVDASDERLTLGVATWQVPANDVVGDRKEPTVGTFSAFDARLLADGTDECISQCPRVPASRWARIAGQVGWLKRKPLYWPKVMGGGSVLHPTSGVQYELTEQKAVDVSLAFHLMLSYSNRKWRKLFFGAGDGDFKTPIQYLVEFENVDLFLIGTMNTISEELGLTREISSELTRSRINSRDPRLRRESDLFRNKASMGRALNR